MPIYEFFCQRNQRIYSFLARSLAYSSKTPRCPDNPEWELEKMMSTFAVTGRAKEQSDVPAGGDDMMDDPRMERAMAEMEREFSSIGEGDNPDPRMLARMMRKMTDLAGDQVPPQMREMIARLEKGEDPDKLEAELGDVFGEGDGPMGSDDTSDSSERGIRKRIRQARITRDPTLYEMSEYCD